MGNKVQRTDSAIGAAISPRNQLAVRKTRDQDIVKFKETSVIALLFKCVSSVTKNVLRFFSGEDSGFHRPPKVQRTKEPLPAYQACR